MIVIENEFLRVTVSPLGAELQSVYRKDTGTEYLWQGDPAYWDGRSPTLFPFIARLYEKTYTYLGQPYPMDIHGFLCRMELAVEEQEADFCTFLLCDSEEIREIYPFRFAFRLTYRLRGASLEAAYRVENMGENTLYYAVGGHPGIRLPLEAGLSLSDYRIRFGEKRMCSRVTFSQRLLVTGAEPFPMVDDCILPLTGELFREDAVVLQDCCREIWLESERGARGVRMKFPDMPYFGIWQVYGRNAPYVCIEPWSALPGRDGVREELTTMPGLWALSPGESRQTGWSLETF